MKEITVAAGVILQNGRILLAQRPPSDPMEDYWEFPGGKLEPGESPEEALTRELKEELGVEILVQEHLGTTLTPQPGRVIRLEAYLCLILQGTPQTHFHDAIEWVAPGDLKNYKMPPADLPFLDILGKRHI